MFIKLKTSRELTVNSKKFKSAAARATFQYEIRYVISLFETKFSGEKDKCKKMAKLIFPWEFDYLFWENNSGQQQINTVNL